jgi:hypothetical protein
MRHLPRRFDTFVSADVTFAVVTGGGMPNPLVVQVRGQSGSTDRVAY